jgi:2-keto-4-pentenoate hydratase/2-oxohepta-3-ene-1,7-dioic acid hydratase in catechol pathway
MPSFARFESASAIGYGLLSSGRINELQGGLFDSIQLTGRSFDLSAVRLLAPCYPPKILAVGLNYKSHLGGRKAPDYPEIFYKPISSIQDPGGPIVIPSGAMDVHYEGELVVVIGRTVHRASREEAEASVFGVTCGNDVSDRLWQRGSGPDPNGPVQKADLQWWRAKGCDTFGPIGPVIVTGLNYSDLALTTRLNGQVVQSQRTSDLLFDVPEIIRYISQYVTLNQGDIIFTGTPGDTRRMQPGDSVEVEIEGIGILRNDVLRS